MKTSENLKAQTSENRAINNQAATLADNFNHASGLSCKGVEKNLDGRNLNDSTGVQRRRQIERLAYNLYLRRGKEPGHALDDWLEAKKQVQTLMAEEASYRLELGHGP